VQQGWTDEQVEQLVGRLLQVGVTISAVVVLAGGILYLVEHGRSPADHRVFRSEPTDLRSLWGIGADAGDLRSRGLIQLGLVLLIATPVARVALTVFAFLRQRDFIFVGVTLLVLTILLYSLFSGYLQP
jgi:uncharacterized membrane protein